jgi:uncharacterized protein YerC
VLEASLYARSKHSLGDLVVSMIKTLKLAEDLNVFFFEIICTVNCAALECQLSELSELIRNDDSVTFDKVRIATYNSYATVSSLRSSLVLPFHISRFQRLVFHEMLTLPKRSFFLVY